ncbi:MAG: hypothetical protein LBU79_07280 [Planctomycetota bacterium]|jgi:hypothetical protein|nr:hypothetical protein [Planctomycetota bacterium]
MGSGKNWLFLLGLLWLIFPGCSPRVICTVETVVLPDYTCQRIIRFEASPDPNYPSQRPRLGDYFQFPAAEFYDTYLAQPEKAAFLGAFDSFDHIPPDLTRLTPGTSRLAGNRFAFRVAADLVFFVLADFDETITDVIVSREDGAAAIRDLFRLVLPEVMVVLNARYGSKFDLSRLEAWLGGDILNRLIQLYNGSWDIRRAKRSGVTSPGEFVELYVFAKEMAAREGLELADLATPDLWQENIRRLKAFAIRKAREICPPRQSGGEQISDGLLSGSAGEELLGALQKAVTARHGSINAYLAKLGEVFPRAFGAYLTGTVMPIYTIPDVTYYYRLRLPGMVIQTNGIRDVGGDILWNFADRDLAFTGQSLWARTLFVRESITSALDVRGFPSSLAEVERMFVLSLDANGQIREKLLLTLQQAAGVRSLSPLEALAGDPGQPDSQAARGVLELLGKYRQRGSGAAAPNTPPAPPPATPVPPPAAATPPAAAPTPPPAAPVSPPAATVPPPAAATPTRPPVATVPPPAAPTPPPASTGATGAPPPAGSPLSPIKSLDDSENPADSVGGDDGWSTIAAPPLPPPAVSR